MPKVTLDSIRAAVEAKYAPLDIDYVLPADDEHPEPRTATCRLVQVMRLPKKKREQLVAEQRTAAKTEDDADYDETATLESLRKIIRLVAETPAQAEGLLADVGDDIAVLSEILNSYGTDSQAGEASGSPS